MNEQVKKVGQDERAALLQALADHGIVAGRGARALADHILAKLRAFRDMHRSEKDTGQIQDEVAYRIRAELVCCDIYERVQKEAVKIGRSMEPVDPKDAHLGGPAEFGFQGAVANAILRGDWHDICYWSEASARIAEGSCPGYETIPNICRCACPGCAHNCSAHQED